jgi:hypothetical protein
MFEVEGRPARERDDVHVRQVRGRNAHERRVRRDAPEPCLRGRQPDERVREIVHEGKK